MNISGDANSNSSSVDNYQVLVLSALSILGYCICCM